MNELDLMDLEQILVRSLATAKSYVSREEIAVAAMQGLLASGDRCGGFDSLASDAVGFADALLAALNKPVGARVCPHCDEPRGHVHSVAPDGSVSVVFADGAS